MFFTEFKVATLNCKLETIRTHKLHKVIKCNKYKCSLEGDSILIPGYSLQLINKVEKYIGE